MARKIALPNIATFNTDGLPFGAVIFLQAVQDGLKTVDEKVVYQDDINIQEVTPRIRVKAAQGQAFTVGGAAIASGSDYGVLVRDFEALLNSHIDLTNSYNALIRQLKGNR